jgi:hypothetical protein
MQPDWSTILSLLGVAVTVGGIYLKQRSDNTKAFAELGVRLTAIETRLQIDDASSSLRREAQDNALLVTLGRHCGEQQGKCPARAEFERWSSPSQVTSPGKGGK